MTEMLKQNLKSLLAHTQWLRKEHLKHNEKLLQMLNQDVSEDGTYYRRNSRSSDRFGADVESRSRHNHEDGEMAQTMSHCKISEVAQEPSNPEI